MQTRNLPVLCVALMLCAICFSDPCAAQAPQFSRRPVAVNDGLSNSGIWMFRDNIHGWAVGETGTLKRTSDGGKTWSLYYLGNFTACIENICFIDDRIGIAVGAAGNILRTVNGGRQWSFVKETGTNKRLNKVVFSADARLGIAVGDSGAIVLTRDSGRTWKFSDSDYPDNDFKDAGFFPDNTPFCVSSRTAFLIGDTAKGDFEWTDKISSELALALESRTLYGCLYDARTQTLFGLGSKGYYITSTNRGASWTVTQLNPKAILKRIWLDQNSDLGYLLDQGGIIYRTTDRGKHWTTHLVMDGAPACYDLFFSKDGRFGWIPGQNMITRSVDGGEHWDYTVGANTSISEMHVSPDGRQVFTAGQTGKLRFSEDGMVTSRIVSPPSFTPYLYGIAVDTVGKEVYVVGDSSVIARYSWADDHWEELHREPEGEIFSVIWLPRNRMLLACGSKGRLLQSSDAGSSWQTTYPSAGIRLPLSSFYADPEQDRVWVVGEKGQVYFAKTDQLSKWQQVPFRDTAQDLITIDFLPGSKVGFITTTTESKEGHLYRTVDGGRTWNKVVRIPDNSSLNHAVYYEGCVYACTTNGVVYKSADQGDNWFAVFPQLTSRALKFIQSTPKGVFFSGNQGAFFRPGPVDSFPVIERFEIEDSSGYFVPRIRLRDRETPLANLQLILAVEVEDGDLINGSEQKYRYFRIEYAALDSVVRWPKGIFPNPKNIHFKLSVSDGWNIASREVVQRNGTSFFAGLKTTIGTTWPLLLIALFYGCAYLLLLFQPLRLLWLYDSRFFALIDEVPGTWGKLLKKSVNALFERHFIEAPAVLDAWVRKNKALVLEVYSGSETVQQHAQYIPLPVTILTGGDKLLANLEKPAIANMEPYFQTGRTVIEIVGSGGAGKTTFALELARWLCDEDLTSNKFGQHLWLPVIIEEEALSKDELIAIIKRKINSNGAEPRVTDNFLKALLRTRRIVVILDALSERSPAMQQFVKTIFGDGTDINALLITSRTKIDLDIPDDIFVYPSPLSNSHVAYFIENLVKASSESKLDRVDEALLTPAIVSVFSFREVKLPISPIIVELAVNNYLDSIRGDHPEGWKPISIPNVYLEYIVRVNKPNIFPEINLRYREITQYLGLLCLGHRMIPGDKQVSRLAQQLEELFKIDGAKAIDKLAQNGILRISDQSSADSRYPVMPTARFVLDPASEFMAALHLAEQCRADPEKWTALYEKTLKLMEDPLLNNRPAGFAQALLIVHEQFQSVMELTPPELIEAAAKLQRKVFGKSE